MRPVYTPPNPRRPADPVVWLAFTVIGVGWSLALAWLGAVLFIRGAGGLP